MCCYDEYFGLFKFRSKRVEETRVYLSVINQRVKGSYEFLVVDNETLNPLVKELLEKVVLIILV